MNDLVFQTGIQSPQGVQGVSFLAIIGLLVPILMIIVGTTFGWVALKNIRLSNGALGGPVLATFAAGLLPAAVILVICGGTMNYLAEEVLKRPRAQLDFWITGGVAIGVWLSFLLLRGMYRGAVGWTRPQAAEFASSRLAMGAIVLTILGGAMMLVLLTLIAGRDRVSHDMMMLLQLINCALLVAGLVCGVLSRREKAARVCSWICGILFVVQVLLFSA